MMETFRYSFEENEKIVRKLLNDGNFFTSNSTLEKLIPRTDFNAINNKVTPIEKILTPEEIAYVNQFPDRKYFYFVSSHKIEKEDMLCPVCGDFRKKYEGRPKLYDTCGKPECYNKIISERNKNKSDEEKLEIRKKREAFYEKKYGPGITNCTQAPEIKEKIKATNLQKFGSEWPGSSEIIKSKIKKTNQEKRGVDYPFQSKEIQEKIPQSFLEKYGTTNINAEDWKKEKAKQTCIDKFGVESYYLSEQAAEARRLLREKTCDKYWNRLSKSTIIPLFKREEYKGGFDRYRFKCKKCDHEFEDYLWHDHIPSCPVCRNNHVSSGEKEILFFIKGLFSNTINIESTKRDLIPDKKEIDIYIPDFSLAIEYDGLFYHSYGNSEIGRDDKDYHRLKTEACEAKGIKLLHIFENEWIYQQDIVKDIIRRNLRKTENIVNEEVTIIKEVNQKDYKNFVLANHIEGYSPADLIIGLYLKNDLISLMSFSKKDDNVWSIVRCCEELNTHITNGFKKLLKYFENLYSDDLYIELEFNKRLFNGESLETLGFSFLKNIPPSCFYVKNYTLYNKEICTPDRIQDLITNLDDNLSLDENFIYNGYRIIFDCGRSIYFKEVKTC